MKKILYFLTYKNFKANVSIMIATIIGLLLIACHAYAHVEIHVHLNDEAVEMLENANKSDFEKDMEKMGIYIPKYKPEETKDTKDVDEHYEAINGDKPPRENGEIVN